MQQSLSYVHGAYNVPLIGATIGNHLHAMTAQFGSNEALVVPHQNVRWTYDQLNQKVTELATGLLALGLQPPGWYLVAKLCRMGAGAIRHCQSRADYGEYQSSLPSHRAGICTR